MLYYNITKLIPIITMRPWFLLILFFISALTHADGRAEEQADTTLPGTSQLRVVASIKPIYSMVAAIMQGVGRPELLLSSNQSPHHYSIRPSERRKLSRADLIFWVSPNIESFMPRLLSSLDNKIQVIALIDTNNLTLHRVRLTDHQRISPHDNQHTQIDAHIWLNTYNIEKMTDEITRQLVSIDPDNARNYKNNNKILHEKINKLRDELGLLLKDKQHLFLTYHDGYQYFEQEFKLKNTGFVSSNPDLRPSARHIQSMKDLIRKYSIQCIFYDAPIEPPIMASLLAGSRAQAIELDPTGIRLPADEQALFKIMRKMADQFRQCL